MGTQRWGIVVPVKLLALAKTRLGAYSDRARAELALAFADDLLAAVLACPAVGRVLVVTDDARVTGALARPGAEVVPDLPAAGLNPALAHGARLLRAADPRGAVAALAADLPALRPEDLADALRRVQRRAFVADADGVGTTLLAAPDGAPLDPAYGPGSSARHRAQGAEQLPAAGGLRRDVDTPDDLREALRLGVGPATTATVAALDLCARTA